MATYNGADDPRKLSRREFVGLGLAAAGLTVLPGCLPNAAAQQNNGSIVYRGHLISAERVNGRSKLTIDGETIVTVDSNGAFRAANFMFSPASTRVELAKSIVDYRIALSRS